ncbi:MAG: methyl-accepting chemotaxis protein [Leptospirales bacterium]|nr:methyl-accepting chemotaxis protein [Leptospirales bacterium]
MFQIGSDKSRLQKKLTLYFLLIAVVGISVSIEMIIEFSTAKFRNDIRQSVISEIQDRLPAGDVPKIDVEKLSVAIGEPISNFRNRIILVMIVICISIIAAFRLFTKDIVHPMDGIVEATKKIADGDLTVTVPVMSEDEIGQIAKLINDMNVNLQDMIMQIKQEIERHRAKIQQATDTMSLISQENSKEIMEKREMRLSDFKKMMKLSKDVIKLHNTMMVEIDALETFVNMYKTYSIGGGTDIDQKELDKILGQL